MPPDRGVSPVRVLVVDDYKEFRELVCLILGKNQNLQVIGEASDGSQAVSKAVELKPNLIVLDIDLPQLNGIEAARQIGERVPESKIVFLSAETSVDLVQQALTSGAWGYVLKTKLGSDLLAAVEAVLQGRQFVSTHLSADVQVPEREETYPSGTATKGEIARSHEAHFHSDEGAFLDGFTGFIQAALRSGNPVVAIATPSHRKNLVERLEEQGVDIAAAVEQGRYIPLDVAESLSAFMVNDLPDQVRFFRFVGDVVVASAEGAKGEQETRVAACGECAHVLWTQGKVDAAIRLEHLWDEVAKVRNVDILCGYITSNLQREQESHTYQRLWAEHSAVSLK